MKEDNAVLFEPLISHIKDTQLVPRGAKVLLMVSGGADSVMLLELFKKLKEQDTTLAFEIFHFNHSIYPVQNDDHEAFVRELAEQNSVYINVRKKNIPLFAKENSLSIEDAARRMRYFYANEVLNERRLDLIATAHNKDDSAETILLALTRGTAIRGLRGIGEKRENVIRPILTLSSKEIRDYLDCNHFAYVTDKSNFSLEYSRNKIRLEVIPKLQTINKDVTSAITSMGEVAKEHEEFIERIMEKLPFKKENDSVSIQACFITELDNYIVKNAFLYMLRTIQEEKDVGHRQINDAVRNILSTKTTFDMQIKNNVYLMRSYEDIILYKKSWTTGRETKEYTISCVGECETKDGIVRFSFCEIPKKFEKSTHIWYIDFDKFPFPYTLRSRRIGDQIFPLGSVGKKSVKKYMIDKKFPVSSREDAILLTSKEKIIAILGIGIAEDAKITSDTKKVLKIELIKK